MECEEPLGAAQIDQARKRRRVVPRQLGHPVRKLPLGKQLAAGSDERMILGIGILDKRPKFRRHPVIQIVEAGAGKFRRLNRLDLPPELLE
jgi:hypothetical protein